MNKMNNPLPVFPGRLRKNDALFIYGASQKKPFVYIYEQQTVEIVHGPSFRVDREIFVDRCEEDGVTITERRGGGGTVVLSSGVLVIVVTGEKKNEREGALDIFHRVHDAVIIALRKVGAKDVVRAGISDLAVGGKKILGSSLYIGSKPTLFYYQSSLMVSNDLTLLDRYLRHPPREPDYRGGRSHKDFCTTLTELGLRVDTRELAGFIDTELKNSL
jgi:lipoate-protein ligase A